MGWLPMRAGEENFETYWYCIDVTRRTIQTRNPPVQTAIVMSSRGEKADLDVTSSRFRLISSFFISFRTVQYSPS